jgi:hypothetical protein
MTEGEYLDHMFGVATGWLGWSPDVAWNSTVPEITISIAAKIDFIQMQNGGKKSEPKKKEASFSSFISSIVKQKETQVHGD